MSSLASPTWHALTPRAITAAAARPRFGSGIPHCDWPTRGAAGVAWSALLLDGHTALEALHELCDAIRNEGSTLDRQNPYYARFMPAHAGPGAGAGASSSECFSSQGGAGQKRG